MINIYNFSELRIIINYILLFGTHPIHALIRSHQGAGQWQLRASPQGAS